MAYKNLSRTWDFSSTLGRNFVSFKDPYTSQNAVRVMRHQPRRTPQVKEGYEQRNDSARALTDFHEADDPTNYAVPFSSARYVPPTIDYNDYVDVDESTIALGTSVDALTGRVDTAETNIFTNTGNITTNTAGISTNAGNITTNTSNITANTGNIAANTSSIGGLNDSIGTLSGRVDNLEDNVTQLQTDYNNLETRVTTNEGDILILDGIVKDIDERTQYIHCIPNVGCIVYDKASDTPLTMYADKFRRRINPVSGTGTGTRRR